MSAGAAIAISSPRVRAISFSSSAITVTLICLALLALSRVVAELEPEPVIGVEVEIAPGDLRARPAPPIRAAPQGAPLSSAEPAATDIAIDRAMLARMLRCFDLAPGEQRPRECAPIPPRQLEQAGGVFPSSVPRDPRALMTPADRNLEAFMGTGPCVDVCIRVGTKPPPPSQSPQQICADGGIGPCGTPIFRAEDVARLAHTQ